MREKSIYINITLNIVRVLLSVIFPLITFPYVSRVLMADNLGKVNYAMSVVNYFALIAALGVSTYGVREGARLRKNKSEFEVFANEIFTVNVVTTLISYILLFITLIVVRDFDNYRLLILLQSVSIILTTIGVDWINSVFEDYLYITIRSFLIQITLLIIMFCVIKRPEDYYKYAFLTVLSNGITCTLNFFYTRKYCRVKIIKKCNFAKHIKGLAIFFANNLAINVYLNADVTMLGLYCNDYTVGIYAVAVKVYNVLKAVIAAMFTACIPRLSAYYGEGREKEYKDLLNDIISNCTLLMIPMICGLVILAKPIVLILSGPGYVEATASLRLICLGIVGAIYGGIMTNCVNLPMKREKYNLNATVLAALINVILNLFFIPLFQEKGAAITTVIAEFTVLIYCVTTFKGLKKLIYFKTMSRNILTGLVECVIIICISRILNAYISNWLISMLLLVVFSVVTYIILLCITKNPVINKIRNRI